MHIQVEKTAKALNECDSATSRILESSGARRTRRYRSGPFHPPTGTIARRSRAAPRLATSQPSACTRRSVRERTPTASAPPGRESRGGFSVGANTTWRLSLSSCAMSVQFGGRSMILREPTRLRGWSEWAWSRSNCRHREVISRERPRTCVPPGTGLLVIVRSPSCRVLGSFTSNHNASSNVDGVQKTHQNPPVACKMRRFAISLHRRATEQTIAEPIRES